MQSVLIRLFIIVLGQSLEENGQPSQTLLNRVNGTVSYYNNNTNLSTSVTIIPTGGDPAKVGITEAQVMKNLLVNQGVPTEDILLEVMAQNTMENAYYCVDLLEDNNASVVALLTSDFHMPRASYIFDAVFNNLTDNITVNNTISVDSGLPKVENKTAGINGNTLIERLNKEYGYIKDNLV